MHRTYLYILGILLFTCIPLTADESGSYSIRKDLRSFESRKTVDSYLMKQDDILHPGIKVREKIFFPPLQKGSLYFILPRTEKAQLTVRMEDDSVLVNLPVSEETQSITLDIPEGRSVWSVSMPLAQELSLVPFETDRSRPEITVSLEKPEEFILTVPSIETEGQELSVTLENRDTLGIQTGTGKEYTLEAFEGRRSFHFPIKRLRSESLILLSPGGLDYLTFQTVEVPDFPTAVIRNGEQILNAPLSSWRNNDFEIFSWSSFPDILIFDFLDYELQNRFLRRLAFFVEKNGYKGKLLSNAELQGKHAWNAHDYRPEDLAEFYNLVRVMDFPINPEEALLRNILISHGILIQDKDGALVPGGGAILSICRESSDVLRYRFFVHEAAHGIYFTSLEYREFVKTFWESLHDYDRAMWRFFLGWYGYDPNEEDLMINEFQAYLLQQSTFDAPDYFGPRMSTLAGKYPAQRDILERGTAEKNTVFQLWAEHLEEWISSKWGLKAGNFFPLHKELH